MEVAIIISESSEPPSPCFSASGPKTEASIMLFLYVAFIFHFWVIDFFKGRALSYNFGIGP